MLTGFLLLLYFFWIVVTVRYHLSTFRRWQRVHTEVRLIFFDNNTNEKVPKVDIQVVGNQTVIFNYEVENHTRMCANDASHIETLSSCQVGNHSESICNNEVGKHNRHSSNDEEVEQEHYTSASNVEFTVV